MVVSDSCPDTKLRRVVIRPNRSLSWRQSMVFLGAIAVPLVLVSVVLALKGYWLILPFAGLELAGLFVCLYLVAHAGCRCEVISIGDSVVTVEKGRERAASTAGQGGPPMVFSHGYTMDHRMFDLQVRAFRDHHRVLVWDSLPATFGFVENYLRKGDRVYVHVLDWKGALMAPREHDLFAFFGQRLAVFVVDRLTLFVANHQCDGLFADRDAIDLGR